MAGRPPGDTVSPTNPVHWRHRVAHLTDTDKIVEFYELENFVNRVTDIIDERGVLTADDFKEAVARAREDASQIGTDYHH